MKNMTIQLLANTIAAILEKPPEGFTFNLSEGKWIN